MEVNTSFTPKIKGKFGPLVLMLVVSLVLGFVAAVGIWQYLNKAQQQVKELSVTRAVVVAAKQIPAGTKLTEKELAIKQVPLQAVPKDYPSSIVTIKDRVVKITIQPDEIISETKLVGKGSAGGMPLVIPPGYRAITLKVNEVIGVGGFVNPGDHVDILSILKKSADEAYSRTILQNVLVLATGDKILDPNVVSEPQAKIVTQVTVALNLRDSEKLALVQETGQLHLVLRPFGEDKIYQVNGSNLVDVYGYVAEKSGQNVNIAQSAIPAGSNISKNSIEIILGDERSYYYY